MWADGLMSGSGSIHCMRFQFSHMIGSVLQAELLNLMCIPLESRRGQNDAHVACKRNGLIKRDCRKGM